MSSSLALRTLTPRHSCLTLPLQHRDTPENNLNIPVATFDVGAEACHAPNLRAAPGDGDGEGSPQVTVTTSLRVPRLARE